MPISEIYLMGIIAGKDEIIAKMYTREEMIQFAREIICEVNNGNHDIDIKLLFPSKK